MRRLCDLTITAGSLAMHAVNLGESRTNQGEAAAIVVPVMQRTDVPRRP